MRRSLALLVVLLVSSLAVSADKFESKDGKYAVGFPKAPTDVVKEADTASGKVKLYISSVEIRREFAVLVLYADYPKEILKEKPQSILDRIRDGVKGQQGKVSDEKALTIGANKVPGKTFVIEKMGFFMRNRVYLDGVRIYQVYVMASKKEDLMSKEADEFLDSFEIKK